MLGVGGFVAALILIPSLLGLLYLGARLTVFTPLAADARSFELKCEFGSPTFGTCSNPSLLAMFQTLEYRITVTLGGDDTWSYDQDTVMRIAGSDQLFHHTDRNTLKRVAKPLPNPAAVGD